jgi:chromosome segregation ATPase
MIEETPPTTPAEPTIWRRLARILLRVLLAIVLGVAIGICIYAGMRAFARQSAALEEQTQFVQALDEQVAQMEETAAAQAQNIDLRMNRVERDADGSDTRIGLYDNRLATVEAAQATQVSGIASLDERVLVMETSVEEMQTGRVSPDELQDLSEELMSLQADVEALQGGQGTLTRTLETIQQSALAAVQNNQVLQVQIEMLKAMQLLARSNTFLEQVNYSQAEAEIQTASQLLAGFQGSLTPAGAEYVAAIVVLLEEAQDDLPDTPAVAANRLEAAWQLLLLGLPVGALPTPTPMP